jgi:hypothetical protein
VRSPTDTVKQVVAQLKDRGAVGLWTFRLPNFGY